MSWSIEFAPLVPVPLIWAAAVAAVLLVAILLFRKSRGALWRGLALAALIAALLNPTLREEERESLANIALVVVDESTSQALDKRPEQRAAIRTDLEQRLGKIKNLEVKWVSAAKEDTTTGQGTQLFAALNQALTSTPPDRIAGVIFITDGQVHDVPKQTTALGFDAPVHALLTGTPNEFDRRIETLKAPRYGLVGQSRDIEIAVRESGKSPQAGGPVTLKVRREGRPDEVRTAAINQPVTIDMPFPHAGTNILEVELETAPGELTPANNRVVIVAEGVRENLRVLLVSGEPHAGERTWRNLLKSDAAVDLVHFTILRPPEAQDFTPVSELSLIAFPIRELFEVKLREFDLVIFDRYRRRDVLAQVYLDNIVRYVRGGGALLIAVGPNFSSPSSLFNSPLGQIMPGIPTGQTFEQAYLPGLSPVGRRHPVTADLPGGAGTTPEWGRWFRHVDTEPRRGQVLMNGVADRPLLLLDRVGEGRVAQMMSDNIWLWARGYDGGGPHAELLRRVAHWLMKEPELEENDLKARVRGNRVEVERRAIDPVSTPVRVQGPDDFAAELRLTDSRGGRQTAVFVAEKPGLYRLTDGERSTLAAVGAVNPTETADVRTTDKSMRPVAEASGGQIAWLQDGVPELRRVRPGRDMGGQISATRSWLGFRANGDYVVAGVAQTPLMPGLLTFLAALTLLLIAWRREGR